MFEAQAISRIALFAGLALAVVLVLLLALRSFQGALIYFPAGDPGSPDSILPGARAVTITTEDGLKLGAWFLAPRSADPSGGILVLHGNAGHRGHRAPLAQRLSDLGWAVLLLDYRGYGGNAGRPGEAGLYRDARAAADWLVRAPGVDAARLVYFGESLGAAVAVATAVDRPPAALILRSPFSSMADTARFHYPFLPVRWLLREHYPSIDRIRRIRCPLLVLAGESDRVIPIEQSRRLFDASVSEHRQLVIFPGADHNDWELLAGDRLIEATAKFLERIRRGAPDDPGYPLRPGAEEP